MDLLNRVACLQALQNLNAGELAAVNVITPNAWRLDYFSDAQAIATYLLIQLPQLIKAAIEMLRPHVLLEHHRYKQ